MSTEGGFGGTSSSDAQQSLQSFWPRVMEEIRNLTVVRKSSKVDSRNKLKTLPFSNVLTKAQGFPDDLYVGKGK